MSTLTTGQIVALTIGMVIGVGILVLDIFALSISENCLATDSLSGMRLFISIQIVFILSGGFVVELNKITAIFNTEEMETILFSMSFGMIIFGAITLQMDCVEKPPLILYTMTAFHIFLESVCCTLILLKKWLEYHYHESAGRQLADFE